MATSPYSSLSLNTHKFLVLLRTTFPTGLTSAKVHTNISEYQNVRTIIILTWYKFLTSLDDAAISRRLTASHRLTGGTTLPSHTIACRAVKNHSISHRHRAVRNRTPSYCLLPRGTSAMLDDIVSRSSFLRSIVPTTVSPLHFAA